MDAKTLEALKGSIKKWNKKKVVDHGTSNCALCAEFADITGCEGCPVAEASGRDKCWGTPYELWTRHHDKAHLPFYPLITRTDCQRCKELQKAELDFLKSLLPEETK